MKTAFLLVRVNLDPVPGTMHTEESAQETVRNILSQRMSAYNPVVIPVDPSTSSTLEIAS